MYMPSYKLNNSYTVYVNYVYLNDCMKASKNKGAKKNISMYTHKTEEEVVSPLPKNTLLSHRVYGIGKVVSTQKGIMTVEFKSKAAKFVYPDAIKQGYLTCVLH